MAYVTGAVSVIALVLGIANFLVTLRLTMRRDIGAIRPVLVFIYKTEGWHIENIGNGPALDVIFHWLSGATNLQNVRLPILAKSSNVLLHFARHAAKQVFAVTYRDADGRPYTTRSQHDVSITTAGFGVTRPGNIEMITRWWQLADSDKAST